MENKIVSKTIMIVFIVMLSLITIATWVNPDRTFSDNENRQLEQSPEFSFSSLFAKEEDDKYTQKFEKYITDQFVLRDTWISIKTFIERNIFLKKELKDVYFASDGYLINLYRDEDINHSQLERNTQSIIDYINLYKDVLDTKKVLIAPTIASIYKEKVSKYIDLYDENIIIDNFKGVLGNDFVDVREALTLHKSEYLYYKTDHHWTTLASYYGYVEYCKSINITPYDLDQFNEVKVTDQFLGTIHSKVNVSVKPDDIYIYVPKEEVTYERIKYQYDVATNEVIEIIENSLYDESYLSSKDKYSYFIGGVDALITIKNKTINNSRHLLLVKDSYSHCMIPFLANHFETISVIDLRYYSQSLRNFIETNNVTDTLVLFNTIKFHSDTRVSMIKY